MAIITISRGSYSRGKEVAEKLARRLGYECISREILLEASDKFHIPEVKLIRAIHDAPSVLERFTHGKEMYVAFIRQVILEHVQKDNVVYHGLGGHFFLQQVPHVLKVRIIADFEARIREEVLREDIPAEEARFILKKDDDERRRWGLSLYGADTWDSSLYDIVLHIRTMSVEDVVDVLEKAAKMPCFQTTSESQAELDNLVLKSQIQAAIVHHFPDCLVSVKGGEVVVQVRSDPAQKSEVVQRVTDMLKNIPGVARIDVHIIPVSTTESLRSAYKMLHFE